MAVPMRLAPATFGGRTVARGVTEIWVEVMSISFEGTNDCSVRMAISAV